MLKRAQPQQIKAGSDNETLFRKAGYQSKIDFNPLEIDPIFERII